MGEDKCFARTDTGGCAALDVKGCEPNCKFYKTRAMLMKQRQLAQQRIKQKDTFGYYKGKYGIK
jgi:hypothetical protein